MCTQREIKEVIIALNSTLEAALLPNGDKVSIFYVDTLHTFGKMRMYFFLLYNIIVKINRKHFVSLFYSKYTKKQKN